jgi:hypothetical protein
MARSKRIVPALMTAILLAVVALGGLLLAARSTQTASQQRPLGPITAGQNSAGRSNVQARNIWTNPPTANGILVSEPVTPSLSPALRDLPAADLADKNVRVENESEWIPLLGHVDAPDPVIQTVMNPVGALAPAAMPAPIRSFEGMNKAENSISTPPDTNGEVGPNHYVQMVNSAIQIWDKSGNPLITNAVNINQLWHEVGGQCYDRNDGDPIVLYDQLADRWLLSQFTAEAPYYECIAISETPDPTATYYIYSYFMSDTIFPDYPHFGMWPDGYYMGVNQFSGDDFVGSQPYVFDRAKMLMGQPGIMQTNSGPGGASLMMPADLDGTTLPPSGAPNPFSEIGDPLKVYKFHVDWATPGNTSWTGPTNIDVASFTQLCGYCIPQPDTTTNLDGLGNRLMYRAAYRNLGSYQSLVLLHNVIANNFAGERWYELHNPTGTPTLYQQGTFAPADEIHRWMGSIAMDRSGNIAIGYSVSSGGTGATIYPGIRYAGRLAGDPLGTMAQGEATLISGSGSQIADNEQGRWGDYSDLTVDPSDDCTFWYTQEYHATSGRDWNTRIGSFKFPSCGGPPPTPVPTTCTLQFSDVPSGSTFYPFVRCLACQGILGGYSDGTFRPNANVTRGQLSKIVSNAAGINDAVGSQMFQDVPSSNGFYTWIQRLAGRGFIGGYNCGGAGEPCVGSGLPYFRPNANATRGQISKIVSNAAGFNDPAGSQMFQDVAPSSGFYTWVQRLASRGYIGGYNCGGAGEPCGGGNLPYFRPNNNATRGQVSKIVANTFYPDCDSR